MQLAERYLRSELARSTLGELFDVELDYEISVFLVEFQPLLKLFLLFGLLRGNLELLTKPLRHFFPLGLMQRIEIEPRRKDSAVGRRRKDLIGQSRYIFTDLLMVEVSACLFLTNSRLVS